MIEAEFCEAEGCNESRANGKTLCPEHLAAVIDVLDDENWIKRNGMSDEDCQAIHDRITVASHDTVFLDPPSIYDRPIQEHGGGKYLRKMYSADGKGGPINVDIYCVIEAFKITCPGLQHALKKILACGQRGKGDKIDDIHGAFDALWRALELQKQRQQREALDGKPAS